MVVVANVLVPNTLRLPEITTLPFSSMLGVSITSFLSVIIWILSFFKNIRWLSLSHITTSPDLSPVGRFLPLIVATILLSLEPVKDNISASSSMLTLLLLVHLDQLP